MAEAELRWFFGDGGMTAAGDMGLASNHAAILAMLQSGAKGGSSGVQSASAQHDKQIERIGVGKKWRRIRFGIGQMPEEWQRVSELAFGRKQLMPGLPAAAVVTKMALAGAARLALSEFVATTPVHVDRYVYSLGRVDLGKLREETRRLVDRALDAYLAVRVTAPRAA